MKILILAILFMLGGVFFSIQIDAQSLIKGEVRDYSNDSLISNANVKNIYTKQGMTIQNDGLFSIYVRSGELIEFTKIGYETVRVRIHNEKEPSYYRIVLMKKPIELREVDIRGKPIEYKADSIRYRKVYDIVLRKESKGEVNMSSMPLAMLSKKNREEWAFQQMYEKWEEDKYIDYVFNDKLVKKITYLEGDELKDFMKKYRPSYDFLRTVSDYEYLSYVKNCYYDFKPKLRSRYFLR
ncbi:MAG TPA: hypothetical protein PKA54_09415 [Chitinophagaceae bacterium]|nr:MAG: hypothetical protein UZ11_BCD004000557 [Bacteroidetes bacterium OLB11]HMN33580.1 hypothetical protein [Chitinophagaceae bacterium]